VAANDRQAREERARLRTYQARQEVHRRSVRRRTRDNVIAGIALVVVLALATGAQLLYFSGGPGTPEAEATPTPTPTETAAPVPSADLAEDRTWAGALTLNATPLSVELDGAAAPQAVSSTISLVEQGFYDGLTCHRLTTEGIFVLQCGDPTGSGSGNPGYGYGIENAPPTGQYPRGTVAMARSTDPDSNGGQWFIVYDDSTLPTDGGGYSIFGEVTSGLEVVDAIAEAGVQGGGSDGTPAQPISILDVTVEKS
jgi:peptidyl-prolyl cis-trans isomerase B (cyclophilin B)